MNREELLKAVDELENDYDAYYIGNRYDAGNTHEVQFELLKQVKGDKVENALNWIHDVYDCYFKNELQEDSAFNYLRECIRNETNN